MPISCVGNARATHYADLAAHTTPRTQATSAFMHDYDAFASLDIATKEWHLLLYSLSSSTVLVSAGDFVLFKQHAKPMRFAERKVWPLVGGGGGRGGPRGERTDGGGGGHERRRRARAGTGEWPPSDDESGGGRSDEEGGTTSLYSDD